MFGDSVFTGHHSSSWIASGHSHSSGFEKHVGAERGQRDRPESQGQASSGVKRMVHNRFEILAEEDEEEGVDHPDFFGAESDTESLAARASHPSQPSSKSHRCIPTI